MSTVMDSTRVNRTKMLTSIGLLYKHLEDNAVAAGQAEMTVLKNLVDALNTLVQAKSQVAGSDFNTLP